MTAQDLILQRLSRLERKIDRLLTKPTEKIITEKEMMERTGYSRETLRKKRRAGVFVGGRMPGKKGIQYKIKI